MTGIVQHGSVNFLTTRYIAQAYIASITFCRHGAWGRRVQVENDVADSCEDREGLWVQALYEAPGEEYGTTETYVLSLAIPFHDVLSYRLDNAAYR